MKVQVVCLNRLIFLPYIHGLLRGYIEEYEHKLAGILEWADPIFLDAPAIELAESIDADVLALSCYMWNFRKQMKIARLVKEHSPNILVVAGGPHIPNNPTGFFDEHPYIDVLAHGEGEITFSKILIRHAVGNKDFSDCGVSTKKFHTRESLFGEKLPKDIELLSPYAQGFMNSAIVQAKTQSEYWAPWETNRGCPYQCSFCDWGSALMNKVRRFSMSRIADDINFFGNNSIDNVYICDANFGMLQRDEEITSILTASKRATGFPKQIRGSFAKNSNDRVFNITKNLMDEGMAYGTTLSVQSMDEGVLNAIDRKNIGITKYQQLQKRYRAEGYHTYTELILGLPCETKKSFMRGICQLLEAGNHEDLRVWEHSILTNAPVAQHLKIYGIQTVTKNVFLELPSTPKDEIETNDIVIKTNDMDTNDWIDSYLFAWTIQALHCGGYTRFISQYLYQTNNISYLKFYSGLIAHSLTLDDCVLGKSLRKLRQLLNDYAHNNADTLLQKVPGYGPQRYNPDQWLWLRLCDHKEVFYKRMAKTLRKYVAWTDEINDLIHFQKEIMLDPSYDPKNGKLFHTTHNWDQYFQNSKLKKDDRYLSVFTKYTGVDDKYLLVHGDKKKFADAAVGTGFLVSRHRHYIHHDILVRP